jgi:hypothetical protein
MNITPIVYKFAPGTKTSGALVAGIKRCLDFTPSGPLPHHHWEVVSYVAPTLSTGQIVLQCKRFPGLQVSVNGTNTTTTQPTLTVSLNAGVSTLTNIRITSADTSILVNSNTTGISTDEAYLVEIEDAIMLYCGKGTDGGTTFLANSLCIGFSAGRIFQAHNKSDFGENIGEWGIQAGIPHVNSNAASAWLSNVTTALCWVRARTSWAQSNYLSSGGVGNRNSQDANVQPLLEPVGDNGTYERFVPIVLTPNATHGHCSYTKYLRARKYRIGDDPGTGVIANGTIVSDPTSTKFAWRHNFATSSGTASVTNGILLWCPSGEEIVVP